MGRRMSPITEHVIRSKSAKTYKELSMELSDENCHPLSGSFYLFQKASSTVGRPNCKLRLMAGCGCYPSVDIEMIRNIDGNASVFSFD